jgi:hypothetical protein
MSAARRFASKRFALAMTVVLIGATTSADTVCDTDRNAKDFLATVNADGLNNLLALIGASNINIGGVPVQFDGLCTDHQITLNTGFFQLPIADAPFTVTPSNGSIRVDLFVPGPFEIGFNGSSYQRVNCDSACVVEIPYIGEVIDGCAIEGGIVGPVVGLLNASVGWDDLTISQTGDTCVLGDCTAVHPVEFTTATIFGFDVDLTGFGSCEINLPPPLDIIFPPFDPCDGFDGLIADLLEPELEETIAGAFVNNEGKGLLLQVFSFQIVRDGCIPIKEVRDCRNAQPQGGLIRTPRSRFLNAALYVVPLGIAGGVAVRARRRRRG